MLSYILNKWETLPKKATYKFCFLEKFSNQPSFQNLWFSRSARQQLNCQFFLFEIQNSHTQTEQTVPQICQEVCVRVWITQLYLHENDIPNFVILWRQSALRLCRDSFLQKLPRHSFMCWMANLHRAACLKTKFPQRLLYQETIVESIITRHPGQERKPWNGCR